jgi:hypothetical protein
MPTTLASVFMIGRIAENPSVENIELALMEFFERGKRVSDESSLETFQRGWRTGRQYHALKYSGRAVVASHDLTSNRPIERARNRDHALPQSKPPESMLTDNLYVRPRARYTRC